MRLPFRLLSLSFAAIICLSACAGPMSPISLKCESQTDPLAIDTASPRFSWQINDPRRSAVQSAWQVIVASGQAALDAGRGDLWDSGQVPGRECVLVPYAGGALASGVTYWWKVRTWDASGAASPWSTPATFGVGFLKPADWAATWISTPATDAASGGLANWRPGDWIWHPTVNGDNVTVYLRKTFDLPAAQAREAVIRCTADDSFVLLVNGEKIGEGGDWRKTFNFDVAGKLHPDRNVIAVIAHNDTGPCGFRLGMKVTLAEGDPVWVVSGGGWMSSDREQPNWTAPDFPAGGWIPAAVLGPYSMAPWGAGGAGGGPLQSMLMRKDFTVGGQVSRARVSVCGLGAYELRLNGRKIGRDILAPGWTLFGKRLQYQTYDVTAEMRRGRNAFGVILGSGWWHGRIAGERDQPGRDRVRLILQLDVDFADGSHKRVLTDGSWRCAPSPVLADDIYDGETYDARLEQPGWDSPGFPQESWQRAATDDDPTSNLVPQMKQPIQAIQELPAVKVTEPKPGVFIFDFGQNLTGWVQLSVSGKPGQKIVLRHGEVLNPDGTLYTENLRSAKATDTYILRGGAAEVWQPRFTYHGFRYAEVTGYPGRPPAGALVAEMICTAAPQTGRFECSNALVNQIQHNIVWGQRGNMYDTPTDCPQRDERLGWTGDTAAFADTACWNLDMERFFTKWMRDVRDCQGPDGAVRDVNPINGGGPAAPAWGDVCVIVPWNVWKHYGDTGIIAENYDCMTRWVGYMTRNSRGYLYQRDGYGDWIAFAGSPKLPISAAYYYHDCVLLSEMARAIGKEADAAQYADLAAKIKQAFNDRYLNKRTNLYPGGSQNAQLLPLYFGLVPEDRVKPVVDNLVRDILARHVHLSTGFLGTEAINPELTANGHHELAWLLATQTTCPSWGYMVKRGATTIWELWNSDTEGPGMNSRNHFCLGSVGEWFFESLGGITPEQPGFAVSRICPRPAGDLKWVKSSIDTPYGAEISNWKLESGDLHLSVTIPPNTNAQVLIPTFSAAGVKITEGGTTVCDSGQPASQTLGARFTGMEGDFAGFAVAAGHYEFVAHGVGAPAPPPYPLPKPPAKITELSDNFSAQAIDERKWEPLFMGLESDAPCDIQAGEQNGQLVITGETGVNYWTGRTLMSRGAFTINDGERLDVQVDRLLLKSEGSGARSSLWLWVDPSNYLMFSEDTEKHAWSYNLNGAKGSGRPLNAPSDLGKHTMRLIHDGTAVHLLLDGKELAKVPVSWREGVRIALTAQARQSGDSVEARFAALKATQTKAK